MWPCVTLHLFAFECLMSGRLGDDWNPVAWTNFGHLYLMDTFLNILELWFLMLPASLGAE